MYYMVLNNYDLVKEDSPFRFALVGYFYLIAGGWGLYFLHFKWFKNMLEIIWDKFLKIKTPEELAIEQEQHERFVAKQK